MDFSRALNRIMAGARVSRPSYRASEQFIFREKAADVVVVAKPFLGIYEENSTIRREAGLLIGSDKGTVSAWRPSLDDLFAEDWEEAPFEPIVAPDSLETFLRVSRGNINFKVAVNNFGALRVILKNDFGDKMTYRVVGNLLTLVPAEKQAAPTAQSVGARGFVAMNN
jgi:hypothetical protein